jgi:hypothetical protein
MQLRYFRHEWCDFHTYVLTTHISANTWIDASVRYLVDPKEAGRGKTRLSRTMLERLKAGPERVLFPKSNLR